MSDDALFKHEPYVRLAAFVVALVLISVWESLKPRRVRVASRTRRTVNNLFLAAINAACVRVLPAVSAVSAAQWAAQSHMGALNWVRGPAWLKVGAALIVLDLVIYAQHVVVHRVPVLWRIHRVHHADLDLDATSGLRFHPVEILLSMGVKVVAVALLGATPLTVILFEIGLNASSIFNHGNIHLPHRLDRLLRLVVVTPDMHRVHHSVCPDETNSNFGFNLSWWDGVFKTYRAQPRNPQDTLELGLSELRTESETVPVWVMLAMPFRTKVPIVRDRAAVLVDERSRDNTE